MAKGVAINVGVNANPRWGGFRGPIFSDGSFEFIHIPWKEKYGMIKPPPRRYVDMPYDRYVPDRLKNEWVLVSPNFCNCTYASTIGAPASGPIFDLRRGDFLLFYSTLDFKDIGEKKEEWINPRWGAYIVGLFRIDSIYESLGHILGNEAAFGDFKDYAWFRSQIEVGDPGATVPWVKGIKEESGLLEKAIPLSSPEDSQKWSKLACDLFKTSRGKRLNANKKAIFQTVLTCEGKCLDKLLEKCILLASC